MGYGYNSLPRPLPPNGYIPQPAGALGGSLVVALRERLDLVVGLSRYAQVRHEDRAWQARARLLGWSIAGEVIQAWANHREARERRAQLHRAVHIAQGWLVAIDSNLALGLAPNEVERNEVVRTWIDLRVRQVQALVDDQLTRALLERSVGQRPFERATEAEVPRG
jgi:hypothetical protein